MFTVDQLVADCVAAAAETEPRLAIKEVLRRAVDRPGELLDAMPSTCAEILPLHCSPDLTVLRVVWAPAMRIRPHNHLMWAAIALYAGQEDNTFYRRDGQGLTTSGGRQLARGDVALLGDDTIHSVSNPCSQFTGAIHVYGGDLTSASAQRVGKGRERFDSRRKGMRRPTPLWRWTHRKLDTSCSRIDTER